MLKFSVLPARLFPGGAKAAQNEADKLFSPLGVVFSHHIRAALLVGQLDFALAHEAETTALSKLADLLESAEWYAPLIRPLLRNVRFLGERADADAAKKNEKGGKVEADIHLFRGLMAQLMKSHKEPTMCVINMLMSLYFKLNNLTSCKALVRTVESFPPASYASLAISQRVTYSFYIGRLAIFSSELSQAENSLSFAFTRCPKTAWKNKRQILLSLVPVRMLRGVLPSPNLLTKYKLQQLSGVVEGLRLGDLRLFNDSVVQNEAFFLHNGLWLLLERIKRLVIRMLVKKMSV
eukprot:TRINITY_DN4035_c0_g1_i2.p1 TRINITY_DN4035_c0_g1~~TRINITY_DN4035_c0_g1_i2.p1  ORF type:complete len:321 (-),score=88.38 TRINITY_DN4035_c0_g1_i2:255-1133(-)